MHVETALDRALITSDFADLWDTSVTEVLPRNASDHSPIVLRCSLAAVSTPRPFRFYHMWTLHPSFMQLVKEGWTETCPIRCPIFRVMYKLRQLKHKLKAWNVEVFGHLDKQYKDLLSKLDDIQDRISISGYNDDLFNEEVSTQADLNEILERQDSLARQKCRNSWLKDGDRNTAFFHRMASFKRSQHLIPSLLIDGIPTSDPDLMANHIVDFYSSLFTADDPVQRDYTFVEQAIPRLVSSAQALQLTKIPDEIEIKAAVFAMSDSSAPGPDGFGGAFYHKCWPIISMDIVLAVQTFFIKNYLTRGLNSNVVILLPKKEAAAAITDFRPIVMSNFFFKIISKILATRLGPIAHAIVSPQQFGFIKGRNIHECIMLASEGINCMDFSWKGRNMACKVDIAKAFDTMSWPYIFKVLHAYGFPDTFIGWINTIFSSARHSILFNGRMHGYFPCTRGVRQGDPLSPIIFGIAEEVLSRLFFQNIIDGTLTPMKYSIRQGFPSHLLYADDVLLFCKATTKNARVIKSIFQAYGQLSGQVCNPNKSHVYFGRGVSSVVRHGICRALNFTQGTLPFNYLGVPLFVGRPRACYFHHLRDSILHKFTKWNSLHLSMAGRICLVQSVIQSSLTHAMLVYRWPAMSLHLLDRACRNFVWTGSATARPACPVSWAKVCSPKEEGGLGLRSFSVLNECYLSKMAWKMIASQDFAFSLLRPRFFDRFHAPKRFHHTSSIWTSISSTVVRLLDETHCSFGDGTSILFWWDDWLGYKLSDRIGIPHFMMPFLQQAASDFFYDGLWHFTEDFIERYPLIVIDILLLPLGQDADQRFWKPSVHGEVTPSLMYSHIGHRGLKVKWGSWIWDRAIPARRSITCWRLIHGRLPTTDLLARRGVQGPNICLTCSNEEESLMHVFWSCPVAVKAWETFLGWFGLEREFADVLDFLVFAMEREFSPQLARIWKIGIITLIWQLWTSRNRRIFDGVVATHFHILSSVKSLLMETGNSKSLGFAHNSWGDYTILRATGVKGAFAPPKSFISVSWWPPLLGWIKVNIDGSARGSPGDIGSGGVFRDATGSVRGCFHINGGKGFAFEAELFAAITAIEIASSRGWSSLWLETDSTFVEFLLSTRSTAVPWRFYRSWKFTLSLLDAMEFRVSHIFREGNSVADIMADLDTPEGWWPFPIPSIAEAVARDMSSPGYFRSV